MGRELGSPSAEVLPVTNHRLRGPHPYKPRTAGKRRKRAARRVAARHGITNEGESRRRGGLDMRDPRPMSPRSPKRFHRQEPPSLGGAIPRLTVRGRRSWWCASNPAGLAGCLKQLNARGGDRSKKDGAFASTLYRIWSTKFPHFFVRIAGDAPPGFRQPDVRLGCR